VERTEKTTICGWNGALESNDWFQLRRKSVAVKLDKTIKFLDMSAGWLFGCK
jgi:hypothetical protein